MARAGVSKEDISRLISLITSGPTIPKITPIVELENGATQNTNNSNEIVESPASVSNPIAASGTRESIEPLELWNVTELNFGTPIAGTKSIFNGNPHHSPKNHTSLSLGHIQDSNVRDEVDKAGVSIVMGYEYQRHKNTHSCEPEIESKEKTGVGTIFIRTVTKKLG